MSEMQKIANGKLQVVCPSCGQTNQLALEKLLATPVCGSCKAELNPTARVVEVDDTSFNDLIKKTQVPVLLDFWAPWCGPCRMLTPVLEKFAQQRAGNVLVAKLNTDDSPSTAQKFGIQSIPTLILFNQGVESKRQIGVVPESVLGSMLDGLG